MADRAAGREALSSQMVRHARTALACYGAGNKVGFQHHRLRARQLADLLGLPASTPANT